MCKRRQRHCVVLRGKQSKRAGQPRRVCWLTCRPHGAMATSIGFSFCPGGMNLQLQVATDLTEISSSSPPADRVRSILTADRVGRKKKIQNFSRKTRLRLYYFVPSCLDFRPWLSSPAGTVPRDARIRRADSAQRNPCTRS